MDNFQYGQLTFERDDVFNRKPFAVSITRLIDEWGRDIFSNAGSLTISIDSPWGTGKSSLIGMWTNYINETEKYRRYKVVYYNAWENTYFDDALRPMTIRLQETSDEANVAAFKQASVNLAECLDSASSQDFLTKMAAGKTGNEATYFEDYRKYLKAREDFTVALKKLVPENGKLVVFVDELDRCWPEFAVETLEIVKHYMSIPDLVFVFMVDLNQISYLVRKIYSNDMDAWGYLRRFFNISFRMPMPEMQKYVDNMLYRSINNNQALKEVKFSKLMVDLYQHFDLNIRDVEKITTNFIIFYSMNKCGGDPDKPQGILKLIQYLYFMVLKYKFPDVYEGIFNKDGYHIEGDLVEGKYTLERRYCIKGDIKYMLTSMQGVSMWDDEDGKELIAEFLLPDIVPDAATMGDHIHQATELFAEAERNRL